MDGNGRVDLVDFLLMRMQQKPKQPKGAGAKYAPSKGGSSRDSAEEQMEMGLAKGLDLNRIMQAVRDDGGKGSPSSGSEETTDRSYYSAVSTSTAASSEGASPEKRRGSFFGLGKR